jgi:toxin CcdB
MPQFAVHRNRNAATRARYPLLLDVQSDLLAGMGTRVVIPLVLFSALGESALTTLTPALTVEGERYAALTPQLAGIAASELGAIVADVSGERSSILAALDLLITGY